MGQGRLEQGGDGVNLFGNGIGLAVLAHTEFRSSGSDQY